MTGSVPRPVISVITATRNVESTIAGLYESLVRQSYKEFEWVVMDGASIDSTPSLLRTMAEVSPWVKFQSKVDFGIYDALNRGIAIASGLYYVVAGADDEFGEDALSQFAMTAKETAADVVLAKVSRSGRIIGGFHPNRAWIGHSKAFLGSHSVGMLFKRELHDRFGRYSPRFPMLADGYFLKLLLRSGKVYFADAGFVAGFFSNAGVSSVSKLQTLTETFQIQMLTERTPLLQTAMFIGKLLYRLPSVLRELSKPESK